MQNQQLTPYLTGLSIQTRGQNYACIGPGGSKRSAHARLKALNGSWPNSAVHTSKNPKLKVVEIHTNSMSRKKHTVSVLHYCVVMRLYLCHVSNLAKRYFITHDAFSLGIGRIKG